MVSGHWSRCVAQPAGPGSVCGRHPDDPAHRGEREHLNHDYVPDPVTSAPHRPPEGPNEDQGWCSTCGNIIAVTRPPGETYGLHADDCASPIDHPGVCEPGGDGHPVAPIVRGWWAGFYEDVAAARNEHGSLPHPDGTTLVWAHGGWACPTHGPLYGLRGEIGADRMPRCGVCITPLAPPRPGQSTEERTERHWQVHRPGAGDSVCSHGDWTGPMTTLPDDDPRAFAAHLREVTPRTHGREVTDAEVVSMSLVAEEPNPAYGVHPIEIRPAEGILCPECVQGKCVNCTGDVLTDDDVLEPCQHRVDKVHP